MSPSVQLPIPPMPMRNNPPITHLQPDLLQLPATNDHFHSIPPMHATPTQHSPLSTVSSQQPAMGRILFSNTENQQKISQLNSQLSGSHQRPFPQRHGTLQSNNITNIPKAVNSSNKCKHCLEGLCQSCLEKNRAHSGKYKCSVCWGIYRRSDFSNTQFAKGRIRKCTQCATNAIGWNEGPVYVKQPKNWALNSMKIANEGIPQDEPRCIQSFSFPCILNNSSWVRADNITHSGTFGNLYRVHERAENGCVDDIDYIMKFTKREKSSTGFIATPETSVVQILKDAESINWYKKYLLETYTFIFESLRADEWEWMSSPTIGVYDTDIRLKYDGGKLYEYEVLLMDYHRLGDVKGVVYNKCLFDEIKKSPQGHVWKLLVDMSFIMNYMNNEKKLYDSNLKLENILISGNCSDYRTTSYIKIDYAKVLPKQTLIQQLNSNNSETRCNFANMGAFVKFKICFSILTFDGFHIEFVIYSRHRWKFN